MDNKEFYNKAIESNTAVRAEGQIGGALRSGLVWDGMFTSNGPVGTYHVQRADTVSEFKIMEG